MWTTTLNFAVAQSQPSAGPSAMTLVVVLAVAVVFLVRSMDRRLRRMPQSFQPDADSVVPAVDQLDDVPATSTGPSPAYGTTRPSGIGGPDIV